MLVLFKKWNTLNKICLIIFVLLLLKTNLLFCLSEIQLENGSILIGTIISQDSEEIKIEVDFQNLIIKKSQIKNIVNIPDEYINVYVINGTNYKGKFISMDKKRIKIEISSNNQLVIYRTNIDYIDFNKNSKTFNNLSIELNTMKSSNKLNKDNNSITNNFNKENKKTESDKNKKYIKKVYVNYNAMWRSALLPSFGQFYKKQKIKGLIIAPSQAILTISTISTYAYTQKLIKEYNENPTRDKYININKRWRVINNILFVATLALYGYNILDALFSRPRNYIGYYNFNNQPVCSNKLSFDFTIISRNF